MAAKNQHFDLSHYGLIEVAGQEAESFLQNQLTCDMNDIVEYGWLLAAWCLPNGRVLSNFIIYKKQNVFYLILPSMMKQKVLQRLGMYVLRTDVSINDKSDEYAIIGLMGSSSIDLLEQADNSIQQQGKQMLQGDNCSVIQFQDPTPRMMLIIPIEKVSGFMNRILMAFEESDRSAWSLLDIESGIPWITEPTSEKFIPQMLNLDLLHGLSFNKGCYPGQEVISRLHFRGELKKRLYLGTIKSDIAPGPGDQLEEPETEKLIGDVIDAEPIKDSIYKILAVADLSSKEPYTAILRSNKNATIELTSVQYPLQQLNS